MVIFILNYCSGKCIKVHPDSSLMVGEKNDTEFSDQTMLDVWLDNHAEEIGFNRGDSYFMTTEEDEVEEVFVKEDV